jgi:hypothetical protein
VRINNNIICVNKASGIKRVQTFVYRTHVNVEKNWAQATALRQTGYCGAYIGRAKGGDKM